jgi:PTH1 family peptidyl-tRNA hydrolase
MKVVVGLGNPGKQYHGTRHNVGFAVLDYLAASPACSPFRARFQSQVAELTEGPTQLLLVKPDTFMNLSGRAVRQVLDFYKVPLTDLFVLTDDINLPLGKLRLRATGSAGGHNGLKSIQEHLGTLDYARLRMGVDAPAHDQVDHVLGRFKPGEVPVIEEAVAQAARAVLVWANEGLVSAMNRFNGGSDPVTKPRTKPKPTLAEPTNHEKQT